MKNQLPFTLLLASLAGPIAAGAQINAYAKVTGISGSTLSLSNANQTYHTFAAGEEVVLMQMQDTVIGSDTARNAGFGSVSNISNAGVYEVDTIKSVSGMPSTLVLTRPPSGTYNTGSGGAVQIISFQSLSTGNYTTTANITGVPWNGSVGGVVAFQVGGTLTVANDITADGLGFRGGSLNNNYEVKCEPDVYDTTSANYGFKGEGIYASATINYTSHTGRAPLINGGGGGSDDNAGGGGGGNYTAGGQGGQGWTCTSSNASGGLGGNSLGSYISGSRVFMGGGGGSGQQNNSVGTAGAAGGGIILIKANLIKTKCNSSVIISAEGSTAANSGNDGAGGGGAGGTVVLNVNSFNVSGGCPLSVEADGGTGGTVNYSDSHGGGGGGGEGAVIYTVTQPTNNVTTSTNVGAGGANSNQSGASGAAGGTGTPNTGIIVGQTPLPITFMYLDASKQDKGTLLTWETGALYQHVLFNVQRSTDGVQYATIGTAFGDAGPSGTNTFTFLDANPQSGNNFYRVEEVDPSGATTESDIAMVAEQEVQGTFELFPNPSPGEFFIRLPGTPPAGQYTVAILDMTGRPVFTTESTLSGNLLTVTPNRYVPAGIYVVQVRGGDQVLTGKLMIKGV